MEPADLPRLTPSMWLAVVESTPVPVAVFDRQMRYIACSRRWLEAYRVEMKDLAGRCHYDVFPGLPESWRRAHARGLAGEVVEHPCDRYEHGDGSYEWIRWRVVPWQRESGEVGGIVLFTEIITEARELELRLHRAQQLLDSVEAVVVAFDRVGVITDLDARGHRALGHEPGTLLGKNWYDACLAAEERAPMRDQLKRLLDGSVERVQRDCHIVSATGEDRYLSWSFGLLAGAGQFGVVGVGEDRTERTRIQHHLQQSQKLEALGTLAAGMAHDVNNVLAIVLGAASLGLDRLAGPATPSLASELRHDLQGIVHAAERGKGTMPAVLRLSRSAPRARRPVSIGEVCGSVCHVIDHSRPKSVAFETQLERPELLVNADSAQIEQVIMNLLINAMDAVGERGSVCLSSRLARLAEHALGGLPPGEYVCIEVRDDGCGMTPEVCSRAVEPFFTTKKAGEGTGLGLALAHRAAEAHGGMLELLSTPGVGTTVRLWLPTCPPARDASRGRGRAQAPLPPDERGRIMVVDDEAMLRSVMARALMRAGHEVVDARNGEEALRRYRDEGDRIDLVLLDLTMPSMGGRACFDRLRAMDPEVAVIVYTGDGTNEAIDALRERGVMDVLHKPAKMQEMVAAVSRALARIPKRSTR